MVKLSDEEQKNLKHSLRKFSLNDYHRVVLDLKCGYMWEQAEAIASVPNLIVSEQDSWFNFSRGNKHYRKFEKIYHRLPPFRLICTSSIVRDLFVEQGLNDVVYVGKAYDSTFLKFEKVSKDIDYSFIGNIDDRTYKQRNGLLRDWQKAIPLKVLHTDTKEEYLAMLNRIRFFISADKGMREYMKKNFEAMACGCILVAFRQGREEEHLGLEDMVNVVLYETVEEGLNKLDRIKQDAQLERSISLAGRLHAEKNFAVESRDRELFDAIRAPLLPGKSDRRPFLRKVTDIFY